MNVRRPEIDSLRRPSRSTLMCNEKFRREFEFDLATPATSSPFADEIARAGASWPSSPGCAPGRRLRGEMAAPDVNSEQAPGAAEERPGPWSENSKK